MTARSLSIVALAAAVATPAVLSAQQPVVTRDAPACRHQYWGGRRGHYCETREYTIPANRDPVAVDAAPNGAVRVEGWDKDQILVRAIVNVRAWNDEDAEDLAKHVTVTFDHGTIASDGPSVDHDENWSVSFEIYVPKRSNLDLHSMNGSIAITQVTGDIRFQTMNGSVHLTDLAGNVDGHTTNGGVHVELAGSRWEGKGLDVETTNGAVDMAVPEGYAARLETGTVNGGLDVDFPVMVQGRISRRISVDIGGGGPTVRAVTTNGGVRIRRN